MSQWKSWTDLVVFLDEEIAAEQRWLDLERQDGNTWIRRSLARITAQRIDEARRRIELLRILRHNAFNNARYAPPEKAPTEKQ